MLGSGCGEGLSGLLPAPRTFGPTVVWNLQARPLPEIPLPNDVATRPDPLAPTGLRINASLVAPTQVERDVRRLVDQLDGWSTDGALTVSFDQPIDVLDLWRRQNDSLTEAGKVVPDYSDDGVLLIDLATGQPVPLDFDAGHYPVLLRDTNNYFLDDQRSDSSNLIFETVDEDANGNGLLDPGEDTNFDGILGEPNFRHCANDISPNHSSSGHCKAIAGYAAEHQGVPQQYDDLLTFYERETRTLIIRPVVPLDAETRYAVLLTANLHGALGQPVQSPFASIDHPIQDDELRPVLGMLPGGIQPGQIQFAWAFTTESTTRDLAAIRAGLYGQGPLSWLASAYPAVKDGLVQTTLLPQSDATSDNTNVYLVPGAQLQAAVNKAVSLLGVGGPAATALLNSYKFIDYLVFGEYQTPDFLDSGGPPNDEVFQLDPLAGTAQGLGPQTVYWWLAVPKAINGHHAPFPVALYGHGYTGSRLEGILGFSGSLARFGVATLGIDAYGHGPSLPANLKPLIDGYLQSVGLSPLAADLSLGRARDLDNSGQPRSGGDFWTADTFHTRDVVRQSVVDWMQLIRIFHAFDGRAQMARKDGTPILAGDFNGDGTVDVSGPVLLPNGGHNPASDFFVWGISLGGILSSILPALEPSIAAAAPVSGGSGLSDIGIRSTQGGVVQAVFLEILGPLVASCHWVESQGDCCPEGDAACNANPENAPALVWDVQLVNGEAHVLIARNPQIHPGDRVVVRNAANGQSAYAVADAGGRVRIPIAADGPVFDGTPHPPDGRWGVVKEGDPIEIDVYPAQGPGLWSSIPEQSITTFQDLAQDYRDPDGHPQKVDVSFMGRVYPPGSPLISLQRGFGLRRNTPDFRRFMQLAQLILDPGDPANYASHYLRNLLPARAGDPCNVLVMATVGDMNVPVNTGISTARAAGIVDMTTPLPAYGGLTADEVLLQGHAVEGLAKLSRFADVPDHPARYPWISCDPKGNNCKRPILLDPTDFSCSDDGTGCTDGFGAPRLHPSLWASLQTKSSTNGISALCMPYLSPEGQHGFGQPSPEKPFDMDTFLINMVGRYFETRGAELHPIPGTDERCMAANSCQWIPQPPP